MAGILYLVATPIGNLEDITLRALKTLKEADLIAAEDTRHSIQLLNAYDIKTPMTSYHEHNKIEKAHFLVEKLLSGLNIALITDAGTPAISDPGEELVRQAVAAGIHVSPVPGAAACICALIMSGLPTRRFSFEAFLPYDKKEREMVLEELRDRTGTIILHESPHHLKKTLKDLAAYLGEDRRICLCREITKKFEEGINTTLKGADEYYEQNEPRGEFVLVIEGRPLGHAKKEAAQKLSELPVSEHLKIYTDQGMDEKSAMKMVAKDRGTGKREIYAAIHKNCRGEE